MADISLLFDVAMGGGNPSGDSEQLIRSQLEAIVNGINSKPFSIKFQADEASLQQFQKRVSEIAISLGNGAGTSSAAFEQVTRQINIAATAIHTMNGAVNASNLERISTALSGMAGANISDGAIADIVSRLESMSVVLTDARIQFEDLGKEGERVPRLIIEGIDAAGNAIRRNLRFDNKGELERDLTDITVKLAEVEKASKSSGSSTNSSGEKATDAFSKAKKAITDYYNAKTQLERSGLTDIITEGKDGNWSASAAGYEARIVQLNRISQAYHNAKEARQTFTASQQTEFTEHETERAQQYRVAVEDITRAEQQKQGALRNNMTLMRSYDSTIADCEKKLRDWSAAENSKHQSSRDAYRDFRDATMAAKQARQEYQEGTGGIKQYTDAMDVLKSTSISTKATLQRNGDAAKTLGEKLTGLAKKFASWLGVSQIIMYIYRSIRKMVTAVIELDTAMTELKKVTDETDVAYDKFLRNAATRAKRLGASLTDVVKTSADFARLGLSLDEAETVSDAALVYKNVGDGIEDIDQASESLISTMQAFGIKAEDVMTIVDKFNVAGNNFAISSGGVGDALLNSASALAAANNTLDESIALITAANETIQNPEKVGKNLPNGTVMCRKKTAISVKGRRRLRPRKDFVVCARRVRSSTSFCYTPEVITMAKKTGVYTQCEYCGKTVYKTLSQYNNRKQHFCSNKCQSLLKREIAFEHRPCEVCGEDMYLSKKSTQRFCSTECQRTWQIGNTGFKNKRFQGGYVKCENCGNDFLLGKYRLELNTRHFCSTACRQTWYADVWSQSDEWRLESKERAANLLKDNPVVTQTKPQLITNSILDSLGITYRNEEVYTYYSLDNYLPEFDLAIEVMGDYWHSSPFKYPDTVNDRQRQVIARDKAKHTYMKKFYGIEILYLWESDILKRPDVCTKLIRHYIECGGSIQNYHSFNYSVVDGRLALNDVIVRPYQDGRTEIAC